LLSAGPKEGGIQSGGGIRVAGFEAEKKSFVSVPVSVTEVKLFD